MTVRLDQVSKIQINQGVIYVSAISKAPVASQKMKEVGD
jgi:hypothetical protein